MNHATCPSPEKLGKYVLGMLSPGEMNDLEKHLGNVRSVAIKRKR